jgi:gas vesicle protein
MASIGKKILSAFVEVTPPDKTPAGPVENAGVNKKEDRVKASVPVNVPVTNEGAGAKSTVTDNRMTEYFDKLFSEANIPGPDYFEFSKMTAALKAVPDEFSRFCAAYAGLQVQGLTKEKLVSTAEEYLRVLDTDAARFHSTVEAALQEKVHGKKAEAEEKSQRIRDLSKEISDLQNQIAALQAEIRESEQKITGRNGDYMAESAARKQQIAADIEKIKQYIH